MAKPRHGNTRHGMHGTPTYRSWIEMRRRCRAKPGRVEYERYVMRGIKVCKRWDKFENFLADMGVRPPGLTLDRKHNSKGYSPSNCRWATHSEQALNRRTRSYDP